jgi:plastocyanin
MRNRLVSMALLVACPAALWSCSNGSLPSSPSALNPLSAPAGTSSRLRTFDEPTPMAVIIDIVSSFGATAFNPNPTMANVGDQIVFTNSDMVLHHLVMDDGTDLGDVAPGQSTAPTALMTPTASFHCTLHPTMVGSINMDPPPPVVDPYYPPSDDYYGYY